VPDVVIRAEEDLGMPHLGPHALGESQTLKLLAHLRWLSIERLGGTPTSKIVDAEGRRLYASVYFVEIAFPMSAPANAFRENDRVVFQGDLATYGRNILDGHYAVFRAGDPRAAEWGVPDPTSQGRFLEAGIPWFRISNIFIAQEAGPDRLKIAQPANMDFSKIRSLRDVPEGYELNRAARDAGRFFDPPAGSLPAAPARITLEKGVDPDRDVNAAGLVYYANFPAFFDSAERRALDSLGVPRAFADRRGTLRRRIGYFGNIRSDDAFRLTAECAISPEPVLAGTPPEVYGRMWFSVRAERASDGALLAITSAERLSRLHEKDDVDRWRECARKLA